MTNNRICDKCKGIITIKNGYIKCSKVIKKEGSYATYLSNHVGDLCERCFKNIIEGKT